MPIGQRMLARAKAAIRRSLPGPAAPAMMQDVNDDIAFAVRIPETKELNTDLHQAYRKTGAASERFRKEP